MTLQKLAFLGFGNVGRALADLLLHKRAELLERFSIEFRVTGIATASHGSIVAPAGLDLDQVLASMRAGGSLPEAGIRSRGSALDFIHRCGADVLFENTPVSHVDGEPAGSHLRAALQAGMHAITANKGPVAHAYRELTDLARANGRRFLFEAAVLDGAPVFSLFRQALPAANLLAFRGILNSTTNIILTRMEAGESFDAAVAYCQQIGMAETDPSADVDGWDAAIKTAILITVLMETPFKPDQVARVGIRTISPARVAAAARKGCRYRLVASAERTAEGIRARVEPQLVEPGSPFHPVTGSTSMIEFQTDVLGRLTLSEEQPGPPMTAYGLLADMINACRPG